MDHDPKVLHPSRCVCGLCPACGRVVVVLNDFESWPLATCPCGWADGITELDRITRYERNAVDGVQGVPRLPVIWPTPERTAP